MLNLDDEKNKILEELSKIENEEDTETKDSEEVVDKAIEEVEEDQEVDEEEQEEEDQEEEEEEEVENDIDEEQLTGAKFRHKLKAEKEARKKLEDEHQQLKEHVARMEGRQDALSTQEAPQEKKESEEIPDPDEDPDAYMIYAQRKTEEKQAALEAELSQMKAEREWQTVESDYAKANEHYQDAKDFLLDKHRNDIKTQYPYATDIQIEQALKQGEREEIAKAAQNGVMPTEQIEFLAYKAGFRPSDKEEKQTPKKKPNMEKIKKNAKKSASLIGGSSEGGPSDRLSADQMVTMSMEEIDKFGRSAFEEQIARVQDHS